MQNSWRIRSRYAAICLLTIVLGLASRKCGAVLPDFIAAYAGDTLWAAMVYFGISVVFPAWQRRSRFLFALLFSYAIECSQLYQAPWINSVRSTTIGALVLGHGFLWSDLVCYTVGVCIALLVDSIFCRKK